MKELQINPSGLLGLLIEIDKQLNDGKSIEEILTQYPVNKTSLPYLLTLMREFSVVLLDLTKYYGVLEKENNTLKEQIRRLQSKKDIVKGKDIEKLQNELKTLENKFKILVNENRELKNKVDFLENKKIELEKDCQELNEELARCQVEVENYTLFFEQSGLCSMFYKTFLRKMGR